MNRLGSGSYGDVYKVYNKRDKKYYAAKKIPKLYRKYTLEENLCKCIHHPNIIQFYKEIFDKQYIYLIMELGEQDFYQRYYSLTKNISLDEVFHFLQCIANAIHYLHHHNIVHADIKIENILICGDTYKLCDFGLSFPCSFVKKCPYSFNALPIPEIKQHLWGKPTDIWEFGIIIERLLLIYSFPKRKYITTFDEKYYKLIKLRNLCFEKDFRKRINIDKVLDFLKMKL